MRKELILPLIVAVTLIGAGCYKKQASETTGVQSNGTVQSPLSGTVAVTIKNFAFSSAVMVVKKGTVLQVTNQDPDGHSLTADDGSFDTGVLVKGQSQSVTLDAVGTFKVHCTPHPSITGMVTVVE